MTRAATNPPALDTFMQELMTIQQTASKQIAILGSRHVPLGHQQLIEILSYALALTGNRILTSGATGTNQAVIRGAVRADANALTVILPQSLASQPRESREQLENIIHLVEHPENNHLPLSEASILCNREIIEKAQQLICFAFHDSNVLLEACQFAEDMRKVVTLFYFD
nr:DNA-processing protein DprA [Gloeobacter kilaueensis]